MEKKDEKETTEPTKEEAKETSSNGGPGAGPMINPPSGDDRDARSVFVRNIHYTADKKEIEEEFKSAGNINTVTILYDKVTRQPKG